MEIKDFVGSGLDDFEFKVRRVRSPEGARRFGQPIGSVIVTNPVAKGVTRAIGRAIDGPSRPASSRRSPEPRKFDRHNFSAADDLPGNDYNDWKRMSPNQRNQYLRDRESGLGHRSAADNQLSSRTRPSASKPPAAPAGRRQRMPRKFYEEVESSGWRSRYSSAPRDQQEEFQAEWRAGKLRYISDHKNFWERMDKEHPVDTIGSRGEARARAEAEASAKPPRMTAPMRRFYSNSTPGEKRRLTQAYKEGKINSVADMRQHLRLTNRKTSGTSKPSSTPKPAANSGGAVRTPRPKDLGGGFEGVDSSGVPFTSGTGPRTRAPLVGSRIGNDETVVESSPLRFVTKSTIRKGLRIYERDDPNGNWKWVNKRGSGKAAKSFDPPGLEELVQGETALQAAIRKNRTNRERNRSTTPKATKRNPDDTYDEIAKLGWGGVWTRSSAEGREKLKKAWVAGGESGLKDAIRESHYESQRRIKRILGTEE